MKSGYLEIQTGHSERNFGANSFYTPAYPDQFEQTKTNFASVKLETGIKFHFSPSFYFRSNKVRFELFRFPELAPSWYKGHNYHLSTTYGANLNSWFNSGLGKTAFGVDLRNENILSNVLGTTLYKPVLVKGEDGIYYTKSANRTNLSLFAEHSLSFNQFCISVGIMANRNSQLEKSWKLFPGMDLGWNLTEKLKLYLSINTSLRMPTFTDLYYSSATNIGNSSLKPEEAIAFETGLKYHKTGIDGHVAVFHRSGKNMIDWVKMPNETIWYAQNITCLNTNGIEFSSTFDFNKLFDKKYIVKSVNIAFSGLTQDKSAGDFDSKYVLDYLRYKINIGVSHDLIKNMGVTWQLMYQDRNGTYILWDGSKYGSDVKYKPFLLVDGRLYWQKKVRTFYLEISNMMNKTYFDFGNIVQPGRWIRLGYIRQINF